MEILMWYNNVKVYLSVSVRLVMDKTRDALIYLRWGNLIMNNFFWLAPHMLWITTLYSLICILMIYSTDLVGIKLEKSLHLCFFSRTIVRFLPSRIGFYKTIWAGLKVCARNGWCRRMRQKVALWCMYQEIDIYTLSGASMPVMPQYTHLGLSMAVDIDFNVIIVQDRKARELITIIWWDHSWFKDTYHHWTKLILYEACRSQHYGQPRALRISSTRLYPIHRVIGRALRELWGCFSEYGRREAYEKLSVPCLGMWNSIYES